MTEHDRYSDTHDHASYPVVQESDYEGHVELVFPNQTIILGEDIAMSMFADCMRIITGEWPGVPGDDDEC